MNEIKDGETIVNPTGKDQMDDSAEELQTDSQNSAILEKLESSPFDEQFAAAMTSEELMENILSFIENVPEK